MKYLSIFLLLFGILLPKCIVSQNYIPYYTLRNVALDSFFNKNYSSADSILNIAFQLEDPIGQDLYLRGLIKLKLKQNKAATYYLKQSCLRPTAYPPLAILSDSLEYFADFDSTEFRKLKDTLIILTKVFYEKDTSLYYLWVKDTVDYFIKMDQKYRSLFSNDENSLPNPKLVLLNDSIVQDLFFSFIKEHGYPFFTDERVNTILLHLLKVNYIKYKELLLNEVKKGRLDPFWYASMVDRLELLYFNNPCVYNIWGGDCEYSSDVILRRREIGLHPIYNGPKRNHKIIYQAIH